MNFVDTVIYTYAKEACYICLAANGLVDTNAYIEGEGHLAICRNCIREAAVAADMPLAEEGRADRVAELEDQVRILEAALTDEIVDRTAADARAEELQGQMDAAMAAGLAEAARPRSPMFTTPVPVDEPKITLNAARGRKPRG